MNILLDMDGVVADFLGGMCRLHGRPWPFDHHPERGNHMWDTPRLWGLTPGEFWAPVAADAYTFWSGLDKTAEADETVSLVVGAFGVAHVAFCSQPQPQRGCLDGKYAWTQRHYPEIPLIITTKDHRGRPPKHWLAKEDTLLIDDNAQNVGEFQAAGGLAFLFPRPWNSAYRDEPEGLVLLEDYLWRMG